ncbi:MAG: hypothetical protein ABI217_00090 [Chthoniobacterales bacterium]
MKSLLLLCVLAGFVTSCTTLSNRRDLYNPSEDAGPYNSLQQKKANVPGGSAASLQGPLPPSQ